MFISTLIQLFMLTGISKRTTQLIILLLLLILLSAVWVWYGVQLKKINNKVEDIHTNSILKVQ